jgi:hypothetical protein
MKKILLIIGICLILVAMPMTTASPLLKSTPLKNLLQHGRPLLTNGSFTGVFAEKNESGYIPLGTIDGTYTEQHSFTGAWSLFDGSVSGTIDGWYWGYIFYGQVHTNGMNESQWFGGLYRVNTTDNSFEAVSIIFGNDNYMIRYAMGTI